MEWIDSLFFEHSAIQAIVVLSLVTAAGLWLGKMHVWGISLGVTFVFFVGILAGHLGISLDADMLNYAESFGLVLFVYALGLQVGPGFFSSLRQPSRLVWASCCLAAPADRSAFSCSNRSLVELVRIPA